MSLNDVVKRKNSHGKKALTKVGIAPIPSGIAKAAKRLNISSDSASSCDLHFIWTRHNKHRHSRTHTEYEQTNTQQLVQYTAIACALWAGRRDIRGAMLKRCRSCSCSRCSQAGSTFIEPRRLFVRGIVIATRTSLTNTRAQPGP